MDVLTHIMGSLCHKLSHCIPYTYIMLYVNSILTKLVVEVGEGRMHLGVQILPAQHFGQSCNVGVL